jgi:hypothetical protein
MDNKPVLQFTSFYHGCCIMCAMQRVLCNAGQYQQWYEFEEKVKRQKLNYQRRVKLAFKYVEVR